MFANHQKVPEVANSCSYLKESGIFERLSIEVSLKSLLLLAGTEKLPKPDE